MPLATQTPPALAHCQSCGAELRPGSDHCPACGRLLWERSSQITLAITLLLLLGGVGLTQYLVNLHRMTEHGLAVRWFTRGDEAMQAHAARFAAEAYRTALNYDPQNQQYRLRLAQALVADNRLAEAHAHLLSLWEEEPADGEVNLTLARLEAKRKRFNDAVRYYNDAINGVWQQEPRKQRTAARFELARYFLQQQQGARAQAELLALLADAPSDPADQLALGQMLLQVNEPAHALQAYNGLLAKDSSNAQAWMGTGEAQLALGNYIEAERALAKAVDHDPKLDDARQQLQLTREILSINPGLRGLPLAERANRVARAFTAAMSRLSACAAEQGVNLSAPTSAAPATASVATAPAAETAAQPAPPNALQLLYASGQQKQRDATVEALRRNPDALEPIMQYVFEVERTAAPICPNMDVTDRALLTLAQHESETIK